MSLFKDCAGRKINVARMTTSVLALTIATQAHAQQAQTAAAPHAGPGPAEQLATGSAATSNTTTAVQEIVVTAQKRSERISDVGMAITAATGDQLRQLNIKDVNGLVRIDPSFVVTESNYGAPVYSIRGVNYNDYSLAASPTVSVYQDEVPYAYPALTKGATLDTDRVEVLKGPQGTLYGQNATGGAVNYIAAKPTSTLSAGVDATYQSYNETDISGFVSGPITDTLKGRVAFETDQGGAYQRSDTRDDTLGAKDIYRGRAILEWSPMEKLKATLTLSGFLDESDNRTGQVFAFIPARPQNIANVPGLSLVRPAPHNDQATDWYDGIRPTLDEDYGQVSGRVDYTLTSAVKLTYLGSYETYRQHDIAEPIGANIQQVIYNNGDVHSLFQEVRAGGELADGRLNWLVGGNYAQNLVDENQVQDSNGATAVYSQYAATGLAQTYFANTDRDVSDSKSIYANAQFKATSTLSLHAGGRYTSTDIDHGGCTRDVNGGAYLLTDFIEKSLQSKAGLNDFVPAVQGGCITLGPSLTPTYLQQKLDQSNFSWRVGADFKPQPGTLLYATISKGFKAGDFPNITASSTASLKPVVQESLLSYETGVKSRLLGGLAEVDGSVFYYDYRNKQLEGREIDPLGLFGVLNVLVNIPKSSELGVELGVKLRPITGMVINVQGTYLDSKVIGSTPGYNGFGVATNYEGSPFPDAPKYAVLIDAQQNFRITEGLSGYVDINARYRSDALSALGTYGSYVSGAYSSPPTVIPAYALLGFRVGLESRDGRWRAQLFGNNVTNAYYITQAEHFGDFVTRFTGAPATYGVSVACRY